MTAHILYSKLDNKNVATLSRKIIKDKIRKKIRFNGILISDDISMKALKYNLVVNAKKSLEAGCNLVLYCAGNTNDNFKLIRSLPYIDRSSQTSEFLNFQVKLIMGSKIDNKISINIPNYNGPLEPLDLVNRSIQQKFYSKLADQFLEFIKNQRKYKFRNRY